jgi:putative restriction endonuclease
MGVSFESIPVGTHWNRERLAELWGYATYHAIARGVVTPRGTNLIVLFVSEEKPTGFTPYEDLLVGQRLHWQGEKGHRTDRRIAESRENGDEIHVFHRKFHRAPFTYLGRVVLRTFEHLTTTPSRAEFDLID